MEPLKEEKDLEKLIEKWQEVNLDHRRKDWDEMAHNITERVQSTLQSRTKLVEQTKKFKELSAENKVASVPGIVRAYQDEIDKLGNRAKLAESAFLSVYQLLVQVPCPVSGLQYCQREASFQNSKRVIDLEEENHKLKKELQECEKEFEGLKNQDSTIFKLETELNELRERTEEECQKKIEQAEHTLREEHIKQLGLAKDREEEIERKLYQKQEEISKLQFDLQKTHQNNEELEKQLEMHTTGKMNQNEMVQEELENLHTQILELTKERNLLKEKLDQPVVNANQEIELNQKERENFQLRESLTQLQKEKTSSESQLNEQIKNFQEELSEKRKYCDDLQQKLRDLPSLEEITKLQSELKVFKAIIEETGSEELTIEQTLMSKNKKLEAQIITLKLQSQDQERKLKDSEDEKSQLTQKMKEKESLIQKLEEDLHQTGTTAQEDSVEQDFDFLQPEKKSTEQSSASSNMLEIVRNQRDRFNQRIQQLEGENNSLNNTLRQTSGEVDSLRKDNLRLYEKVRYLSSAERGTGPSIENNNSIEELDSPYHDQYEESIHPFALFSRKERNQRIQNLNPAEKVVYTSSKFFLASKETRLMLFVYSLLLHLLVFWCLYRLMTIDAEIHSKEQV